MATGSYLSVITLNVNGLNAPTKRQRLAEWIQKQDPYKRRGTVVENLSAKAGDARDAKFNPWIGKIPWRRKWQPTPVFLPGESHGQMSLVGYSPGICKVLDMTEQLSTHNLD